MVLLIKPDMFSLTQHPPIGIGYLASSLKQYGISARVLDLQFPEDCKALYRTLVEEEIDWIGISVTSQNLRYCHYWIDTIRNCAPDMPVVLGGTYPSVEPERCINDFSDVIVAVGEGEETVVELDAALRSGEALDGVKGILFKRAGSIVRTAPRPRNMDLDTIPMPDYSQIPPQRYSNRPWQILRRGNVVGSILTSRGCPHSCAFCAAPAIMGHRWRFRSPRLVVDEMEFQCKEFGVDEFHIVDDNLVGKYDHATAFCEQILSRNMNICWKTPNGVRSELLDEELIVLMKKSGCYMLGFGVESGDPEVLRQVKKRVDLPMVLDKMRIARKHGIVTFAYFIIGLPWDTRESIEKTIQVSIDSGADLAHFAYCVPTPGSRIYRELDPEMQLKVLQTSWFFLPNHNDEFDENELRRLHRKAIKRFYLRPRIILLLFNLINRHTLIPILSTALFYFRGYAPKTNSIPKRIPPQPRHVRLLHDSITLCRSILESGFSEDRLIIKKFYAENEGRVLDIGCGDGIFSELFPADKYLGIDSNEDRIANAQTKYPLHSFLNAEFPDISNLSGKFNMILLSKIIHHLDDATVKSLLGKASELLHDSGVILILEPSPPEECGLFHRIVCKLETGNNHRSVKDLQSLVPSDCHVRKTGEYKNTKMKFYYILIEKQ